MLLVAFQVTMARRSLLQTPLGFSLSIIVQNQILTPSKKAVKAFLDNIFSSFITRYVSVSQTFAKMRFCEGPLLGTKRKGSQREKRKKKERKKEKRTRKSPKGKQETKVKYLIPLHEKFLQFDWLRAVVFQLNLKYLHVKITTLLWVVV